MEVTILGVSFTLQSDEDDDYLKEVLHYFEEKLDKIQSTAGTKDPLKLAILVALLVSDEVIKIKTQIPDFAEQNEATQITQDLIFKLSEALKPHSF